MNSTAVDRAQDRRIEEARQAAMAAAASRARSQRLSELRGQASEDRLRAVIKAQEREIIELEVALVTLVELLRDTGVIDETVYRYRVEGELASLDASAAVASQESGAPGRTEPDEQEICSNCGGEFPRARTNITSQGILCDRCNLATTF